MNRVLTLVIVTALVGCGSKKKDEPPAATPSRGSAMPSAGSATSASGSSATAGSTPTVAVTTAGSASSTVADLPTEMDFEAQATTKITDKNVEAQVKTIEDDLGK